MNACACVRVCVCACRTLRKASALAHSGCTVPSSMASLAAGSEAEPTPASKSAYSWLGGRAGAVKCGGKCVGKCGAGSVGREVRAQLHATPPSCRRLHGFPTGGRALRRVEAGGGPPSPRHPQTCTHVPKLPSLLSRGAHVTRGPADHEPQHVRLVDEPHAALALAEQVVQVRQKLLGAWGDEGVGGACRLSRQGR